MRNIGAVVLAAGGSSRLGQPKQLLKFRGETLVRRVVGAAEAGCDPIVVVVGETGAAIRDELARSARRTASKRAGKAALPARDWTLDRGTTKVELERALLAIDVFPRCALLLSVFEGVSLEDVAILLDSERDLVRKAQMIGLRELTGNLARSKSGVRIKFRGTKMQKVTNVPASTGVHVSLRA